MNFVQRLLMVRRISQRTLLKNETVYDLLKNGWSYEENLNEPSKFVSPFGRLTNA